MSLAGLGFGLAAGVLSTLSPCVLPLLPLLLAGAASAHRLGIAALVAGLALSFVAIGLFVATVGFSLGLTGEPFRLLSATILAGLGVVLLSGALQAGFARRLDGVGAAAHRVAARLSPSGVAGQFLLGVLLGAIWSPCVGPTLGAASLLAAQSRDLGSVAATMLAFALGSTLPLLAVGTLSRGAVRRWQARVGAGRLGRRLLGGSVLALALLILSGADRSLEAWLVAGSPAWLTDLTTRF